MTPIQSKKWEYIDTFMVFINISTSYSIIPYIIFFQYYRAINTSIIFAFNVIYIVLRFGKKIHFPGINKHHLPFILFILINITNTYFGLFNDDYGLGMIPFIFSNFTFYLILWNLYLVYSKYLSFLNGIWMTIRGYIFLFGLNTASVLILFSLITFFNFYPLQNEISGQMDLFKSNVDSLVSTAYYFPYNISIILDSFDIRLPFFQKYGIICGLFHEPHTMMFVVSPALFILLYRIQKKPFRILVISIYVLTMFIAASTTNVISFAVCAIIYLLFNLKKNFLLTIFLLVSLGIIVTSLDSSYYQFILDKSTSRSRDYSMSTISFAFSPTTLFGNNFYDLSYWDLNTYKQNIGYINFFINLFFLLILIYRAVALSISKLEENRIAGLMLIYFLFHSAKVAMFSYSLSLTILILFISTVFIYRPQQSPNNSSHT